VVAADKRLVSRKAVPEEPFQAKWTWFSQHLGAR